MARWIVMGVVSLALATAGARAQKVAPGAMDGGGATAVGGVYRVQGAILGAGLPAGHAGRSTSAASILGVGFFPALAGALAPMAAAGPLWLEYACRNAWPLRTQAVKTLLCAAMSRPRDTI